MPETPAPAIGIVTISDRAHAGTYEDRGGPAVREYLRDVLSSNWRSIERLVPDERAVIEDVLRRLVDEEGCCLVLTTGGTGPAPRDVTPEATRAVAERELPGFGEAMRGASLRKVPTAILSRQTAIVRGACVVINLPGSPKAIAECLDAVFAAVPHAVRQVGGPTLETRKERLVTDAEVHDS
ncbi:MAG: molybdopterin adenylyltransferase [Thermoanaerobaculia bacterium]|nr:molybdopterin adenylyltransferase [Thermoanaerobaculia bacterium]